MREHPRAVDDEHLQLSGDPGEQTLHRLPRLQILAAGVEALAFQRQLEYARAEPGARCRHHVGERRARALAARGGRCAGKQDGHPLQKAGSQQLRCVDGAHSARAQPIATFPTPGCGSWLSDTATGSRVGTKRAFGVAATQIGTRSGSNRRITRTKPTATAGPGGVGVPAQLEIDDRGGERKQRSGEHADDHPDDDAHAGASGFGDPVDDE